MNILYDRSVSPVQRVFWTGLSGTRYEFQHFPIGTVFNPVGGVYIFCKAAGPNNWHAVYVGETDNFLRRLTNELATHHRWDAICRIGATHVSALVTAVKPKGRQSRLICDMP